MLHVLMRKARNFLCLPAFIQLWMTPTWLILGICKALIFTISFRRLAPCLGHAMGTFSWVPLASPAQQARARQIGQTIQLAARYTPWNSNCFPQAVAARLLLGLYGIPYTLCFGLARDADSPKINAHAWVTSGRVSVTGGESFSRYAVVGVFASPGITAT